MKKASKEIPVLKYIKIEERKGKYGKDVYFGLQRSASSDGSITAMVVKTSSDHRWIHLESFSDKDFEITEAAPEDVRHFFKVAMTDAEKEMDSAEFDLREKKRNMSIVTERFGQYFSMT